MEFISQEDLAAEVDRRFLDTGGGYDLWKLEDFILGVSLAVQRKADGKGPADPETVAAGIRWATNKILLEEFASKKELPPNQ